MNQLTIGILLFAVGMLMMVLELFIPSGGALSCLAAFSIVAAIIVGFTHGSTMGVILLGVTAVWVPLMFVMAVKFWPHTPLGKIMLIQRPTIEETLPESDDSALKKLVGRTGRAKAKMLPSGPISIEGQTFDAVSEGMPIEVNQLIQVIAIRANRPVVRPIDAPAPESTEIEQESLSQPAEDVAVDPFEDPLV